MRLGDSLPPGDLPRQFANRDALEATLRQLFPEAPGGLSPIQGGRRAAESALAAIDPAPMAAAATTSMGR